MQNKQKRQCPHCNHNLTAREAIIILHGSGFEETVPVKMPDGTVAFMEVGTVYPNEVEVLNDK